MTKRGCAAAGCLTALAGCAVLAAVMALTCPKPADHYAALNTLVGQALDEQISSTDDLSQQVVAAIGRVAFERMGSDLVQRMVSVDNYVVVSIGRLHYQGKDRIVTVGLFGHVVTPSKEQLAEAARKAL